MKRALYFMLDYGIVFYDRNTSDIPYYRYS